MVGRSEKITGPYLDKKGNRMDQGGGSLLLSGNHKYSGVGHNAVYTFDGKDYIFFHAYDARDEYKPKLMIRELHWQNDWPENDLEE
jgi:arabinan endo-1,5-alpha-L-arabinosidase